LFAINKSAAIRQIRPIGVHYFMAEIVSIKRLIKVTSTYKRENLTAQNQNP